MAGCTLCASICIKPKFNKFDFTEQSVKGTEGAGHSTKWPAGQNSPSNKYYQNEKFVEED